jgi:DEAD/DEAH box helicase
MCINDIALNSYGKFTRAVEHYCKLNLQIGGLHPFNTLQEYQRFASSLAYSTPSPPTTALSSDAKIVTYKDKTMHLDNWISGMRHAYNDSLALVQTLCRNKDFSVDLPDNFVDNMTDKTYGYSWLESVMKSMEDEPLMEHLLSNTTGDSPCKFGQNETLIWDAAWQLAWMRKAGELNLILANLHHTVPGQPSRIAELCDFRIRNGLRGRNTFYDHGALWLIGRRVKSETLVHHEDFIPVKLPPELSQLFIIYLLFIRPVEINFSRRLWGEQVAAQYHGYLYILNGVRLLEDQFYLQFKKWTELYFQCALGVRGYRQSVVVIARAYLGTEYELELEEEDDALIKQRGHGALSDRRCYGVQSRYLTTLTSDLMFRFGHMSEWWWRLTQFHPGKAPLLPLDIRRKTQSTDAYNPYDFPQPPTVTGPNQPLERETQAGFDADKLAEIVSSSVTGAIHSLKEHINEIIVSQVAAGVAEALSRHHLLHNSVTRQASTTVSASGSMKDFFPLSGSTTLVSTPKESLMHLPPRISAPHLEPTIAGPSSASPPFTVAPESDPPTFEPMDVDTGHASQTAMHYLKLFYQDTDEPKFRSAGQQQMVELAFAGKQNFVGVLPTGGGKSLVFLLPALAATMDIASDGTVMKTLVVVPNKSLLVDTMQKAMKHNISCIQWLVGTNIRIIDNASLILIAIESLDSYKFKWYVCF